MTAVDALHHAQIVDDDASLVAAACVDPLAFERLYRRYVHRVYRYALAKTGSASVADDIVSDTMLAALASLTRFDPERGVFSAWLFTIARRRVQDWERSQRRWWRLADRHTRHVLDTHTVDDGPLASALNREEMAETHRAIARLGASDRELVLLRFGAELSIEAIADILKISRGATRTRLSRALDRLEAQLEQQP